MRVLLILAVLLPMGCCLFTDQIETDPVLVTEVVGNFQPPALSILDEMSATYGIEVPDHLRAVFLMPENTEFPVRRIAALPGLLREYVVAVNADPLLTPGQVKLRTAIPLNWIASIEAYLGTAR